MGLKLDAGFLYIYTSGDWILENNSLPTLNFDLLRNICFGWRNATYVLSQNGNYSTLTHTKGTDVINHQSLIWRIQYSSSLGT